MILLTVVKVCVAVVDSRHDLSDCHTTEVAKICGNNDKNDMLDDDEEEADGVV